MRFLASRLLLCLILLLSVKVTARHRVTLTDEPVGIVFQKGSWNDVLAEAKRQNKPVFLDMYTSWCPPCKRMAKEAFPNQKVGAKYNVHFINYQLDAEKGEGVRIARQYAVSSYPTALFITATGELIHRAVGYGGIDAMITQANYALALPQLKTTLAKGDKAYADGKRDPNFLKKYLQLRQTLHRPVNDVLDAYIEVLAEPERVTPETITYVAQTIQSSDTKAFAYLLKNRPSLLASDLARQQLAKTIYAAACKVLTSDFEQAVATRDERLLDKVILNSEQNTASANPLLARPEAQKQEAANAYRLSFYKQTKNFAAYRTIAEPIAHNQLMSQSIAELHRLDTVTAIRMKNMMVFLPDSIRSQTNAILGDTPIRDRIISWKVAHSLSEIADTYAELGTSAADWELALTWSQRAVTLYRSHGFLHTYARLLKKTGRSASALDAQKEAIREADKERLDTSLYQTELADMERK